MFKHSGIYILFFILVFLLPSKIFAASYYVSVSGNDTNAGTQSQPWKTILKATTVLQPGDQVMVSPGTYAAVSLSKSGTQSNQIMYKAAGTGVIVQGFIFKGAQYTTIDGFEITGSGVVFDTPNGGASFDQILNNYIHDIWSHDGITTNIDGSWVSTANTTKVTHNLIKNNRITRVLNSGLLIMGQYNTIEGNDISHAGDHVPGQTTHIEDANGIRFFGTGHIFRKNIINISHADSLADPHLDCYQSWYWANHILFEGNYCRNPDTTLSNQMLMFENQGGTVGDITFRNNIWVMSDPGYVAFNVVRKTGQGPITNFYVYNNVFAHVGPSKGGYAIRFLGENAPITNINVKNNLFIDWGDSNYPYVSLGNVTGVNISNNAIYNLDGIAPQTKYPNDVWMLNPLVVNIPNFDFHLTANSPLINKGTSVSDPTFGPVTSDFDGNTRPVYGNLDIGAYEYGGTGGSTPVPTVSQPMNNPTMTIQPSGVGGTQLLITLLLHGIGKGGDNVNPQTIGTMNPIHPQRIVTIDLTDANNHVTTKQGTISFNATAGNFQGTVAIGTISSGAYTIRFATSQYLGKLLSGIVTLTNGQTSIIPAQGMVAGDTNGDNKINILDYNMLLDCFSDLGAPRNCADATKKQMTDLTDDGSVNQFDYNLFLRELSVQSGQ